MGVFSKERTEKDVLNRIKWDNKLNPEDFEIAYLDKNEIARIPYTDAEIAGDFLKIKDALVPMHRVRQILCKGEVVWAERKV